MRTVVDASVALRWYFDEPGVGAADRLLAEYAAAGSILALWEGEQPSLVPGSAVAARALTLAVELDQPVYDCLYLATALAFDAGFATADRALARAARGPLTEVLLIEG